MIIKKHAQIIRYVFRAGKDKKKRRSTVLSCENRNGFNSKSVLINIVIISPPTQTSDFSTNKCFREADGVWAANRTSRLIIRSRIRRAPVCWPALGLFIAISRLSASALYSRIKRGSDSAVNNAGCSRFVYRSFYTGCDFIFNYSDGYEDLEAQNWISVAAFFPSALRTLLQCLCSLK